MIQVLPYTESDATRWDAFVRSRPESHFGQRTAWKRVTERGYGCAARYRLAVRDGHVVGILPLFEKRGLGGGPVWFSAPGGLLAEDDTAARALLDETLHEVRGGMEYLELRDQTRAWPGLETVEENCSLVLDLASGGDAQWDALGTKLRNKVRKGLKSGFRAVIGREAVNDFHRVLCENMRDLGTPILGPSYFRSILDEFGEEAWLVVLYDQEQPVGAMFLIANGRTVQQPWSSSRRRWFEQAANYALHWEAIRDCAERGFARFDFGRSQWHSGTFAFKEQWSAVPQPLYYQYALGRTRSVPTVEGQKGSLALAVETWKRLPLPLARVLGPVARRRFPEAL